ncbi:MAG: hypothetical protein QY326_06720 [Bdellovibrionota bacterium]|nr:MAG: hypothetical protein QY326_06720 [Bdellovibrionota bacterium]
MSTAPSPIRRACLVAVAVFLLILLLGPYLGLGRQEPDAPSLSHTQPSEDRSAEQEVHRLLSTSEPVGKARAKGPPEQKPGTSRKEGAATSSDRKFSEIEDLLGN